MEDNYKTLIIKILSEKKKRKLTWDQMAINIPIAGNSLRMAFKREIVKSEFLEIICRDMKIPYVHFDSFDRTNLSEYVKSLLIRTFEFDFYKDNFDNNEYLKGLPVHLWKISEIKEEGDLSKLRTFQIVNNEMNDGSYKSILLGDLILCNIIPRNDLTENFEENGIIGFLHWEHGIKFRLIEKHNVEEKILSVRPLSRPDFIEEIKYADCSEFYKILLIERKFKC